MGLTCSATWRNPPARPMQVPLRGHNFRRDRGAPNSSLPMYDDGTRISNFRMGNFRMELLGWDTHTVELVERGRVGTVRAQGKTATGGEY